VPFVPGVFEQVKIFQKWAGHKIIISNQIGLKYVAQLLVKAVVCITMSSIYRTCQAKVAT